MYYYFIYSLRAGSDSLVTFYENANSVNQLGFGLPHVMDTFTCENPTFQIEIFLLSKFTLI